NGYVLVVQRFFTLGQQRYGWVVGYGFYVLCVGTCAYFLWKSRSAAAQAVAEKSAAGSGATPAGAVTGPSSSTGITAKQPEKVQSGKSKGRHRDRKAERASAPVEQRTPAPEPVATLSGDVTFGRRMR